MIPMDGEFVVIRHAQSVGDVEKRDEGRADFPLTDTGREQAQLAAVWVADHVPPDVIYASPMRRAAETAEILDAHLRVPLRYRDDLKGRHNGVLAGLTYGEADARYPLPAGGRSLHQAVEGGESAIAFRTRIERFWSRLLAEATPGQRIGIVTHGATITMLFCAFLNLPLQGEVQLKTSDAGIHLWRAAGQARHVLFANREPFSAPATPGGARESLGRCRRCRSGGGNTAAAGRTGSPPARSAEHPAPRPLAWPAPWSHETRSS